MILQGTIPGVGRKDLLQLFVFEAQNTANEQWRDLIGNVINSTQSFEKILSLIGLGPAEVVQEGDSIPEDSIQPLFSRNFRPNLVGKKIEYSKQYDFTAQYADFKNLTPQIARAFVTKKNILAANLFNLGFTDTTAGMNSETLFSTTHANGNNVLSNTTAANQSIALGPVGIQQGIAAIRGQLTARGVPALLTGPKIVFVPPALEGVAYALQNSDKTPFTNNNEPSFAKNRVEYKVNDFLTSPTAWFMRMADNAQHKLMLLQQMPYDVERLSNTDKATTPWIATESYLFLWADAHGVWATPGL